MNPRWSPAARGIVWMVAAQALFGVMNVFTRLGARDLPWSEVAAARFLVGAALAAGLAAARGASLRITDRKNTWLRSIFGTCASLGAFYALGSSRIPLGDAATLQATAPIFVALLSPWLLGEPVGERLGLAIVAAFLGVAALVQPAFVTVAPVAAAATAGAVAFALAMIWLRKIGPGETAEAVVLHFSLTACATMLAISIPVWVVPDRRGLLLLAATGLTGGLGQVAMTRAYALDGATRITTLSYLGIAFTYLLQVPVFGDPLGPMQLLGAGLIMAAGWFITPKTWTLSPG